jgi:hypothetical protein
MEAYTEELQREERHERSNCGSAEMEVAFARASEANNGETPTSKQVVEALDEWRKQFSKDSSIGSSLRTREAWEAIYAESERAARERNSSNRPRN